MNEDIVQEILHELFSSLETLETQSSAVLQLLKDKGLASEQELALQLEKAGNASNVRWRAAQVRIDHLVSSALKTAEREAKQPTKNQESPTNTGGQTSRTSQGEEEVRSEHQAPTQKSDDTSNKKNQSQQAKESENEGSGDDARKNAA